MAQDKHPDSRILTIPAVDGYPLHARVWQRQQAAGAAPAPVVIINPATSVLSRYYSRLRTSISSTVGSKWAAW